jgi:hypothetical protein
MTEPEYEQLKKHLEEQRRIGLELVERAYEAQMRALEMIRTLQGGSGPVALATAVPPPAPEQSRHKKASDLLADLQEVFPGLPERFSRRDVCAALGYEPDRGALYKLLQAIGAKGKDFVIETVGKGQTATIYRKMPD